MSSRLRKWMGAKDAPYLIVGITGLLAAIVHLLYAQITDDEALFYREIRDNPPERWRFTLENRSKSQVVSDLRVGAECESPDNDRKACDEWLRNAKLDCGRPHDSVVLTGKNTQAQQDGAAAYAYCDIDLIVPGERVEFGVQGDPGLLMRLHPRIKPISRHRDELLLTSGEAVTLPASHLRIMEDSPFKRVIYEDGNVMLAAIGALGLAVLVALLLTTDPPQPK